MSRKYSIGFLIGIILLICLFVFGFSFSYNRVTERDETNRAEEVKEVYFFIREKDGYVTVYNSDGTVYEYTSILKKDLPETIQEEMKSGIKLSSLSEVYGFLENYSS